MDRLRILDTRNRIRTDKNPSKPDRIRIRLENIGTIYISKFYSIDLTCIMNCFPKCLSKLCDKCQFISSQYPTTGFLHVKPGKGPPFVGTKLHNYVTGNTVEKTFRAGNSPQTHIFTISLQFSRFYFLDPPLCRCY